MCNMQLQLINSVSYGNVIPAYRKRCDSCGLAMPVLQNDVFIKSPAKQVSFGMTPDAYFGIRGLITKRFVSGLSPQTLKELSEYALSQFKDIALQLEKKGLDIDTFIKDVMSFTTKIKQGLDEQFGEGNYVFVSVGQSPAIFAEILKEMGVETAICPISNLTNAGKIFKSPSFTDKFQTYLKYMENVGLSPEKIKTSNKAYIFTDYTNTGSSLKTFKKILCANGYQEVITRGDKALNNVLHPYQGSAMLVSLQGLLPRKDDFCKKFIKDYLKVMRLKHFSPIFRLPYWKIDKINDYMTDAEQVNANFNMLKFLILKKMLNL